MTYNPYAPIMMRTFSTLRGTGNVFEDIAADFPWLKPFYFGKGKSRKIKRWQRAGVEALRYILANTPHEEASRAKPETKSSDGGG